MSRCYDIHIHRHGDVLMKYTELYSLVAHDVGIRSHTLFVPFDHWTMITIDCDVMANHKTSDYGGGKHVYTHWVWLSVYVRVC